MIVEESLRLEMEPNGGWDPRIHCAKCGDLVRAYLLAAERFVLVYDTLLGPKSGGWLRQQALEIARGRPLLVVNSHADWDHYFGNMSFPDPILASRLCGERIRGEVGAKELAQKRAEHPDCYGAVRLLGPTVAVSGETVLHGGDLTFRLLPTAGHRPDHLALHIPEIDTLLPGDCVEDPIPLVDEDSTPQARTLAELIVSLQTMAALKPRWVLANHAPPQAGIERIESNLAYLSKLRQQAARSSSLDALRQALPAQASWGDFYRGAHEAQLRMAWEQRQEHIV
jgi:glyoxylase-like metal-dependent hydrolase (beta-lactamase superfamily II)